MRVKSIKLIQLDSSVPVYDITVPQTSNFKLHNGPYVHNSKDISDALAGVVYGLTMRREIWALHGVSAVTLPKSVQTAAAKEKADKLSAVV